MIYVPTGHAAVIGRAGQGKSYLLRRWCRSVDAAIFIDPTWGAGAHAELPVGEVVRDLDGVAEALQLARGGRVRVTLWPDDSELADVLDSVCALALVFRDCVVAADEASVWLDPRRPLPDSVTRVLRRGRHDGVRLWTAAHRPADLPRLTTANADVAAFRITEPGDLTYMRGLVGRDAADRIARLPQWRPIVATAGGRVVELDEDGRELVLHAAGVAAPAAADAEPVSEAPASVTDGSEPEPGEITVDPSVTDG